MMYKNLIITACILVLISLSVTKFTRKYSWDITQNQAHTLNSSSKQLLDRLDETVKITIYSPDINIINATIAHLERYKQYSNKIVIESKQTVLEPTHATKLNLFTDNNLMVSYKNTQRAIDIRLSELSEEQISTLLQVVTNAANHWLVFLTGHQEADPTDTSEFGLSRFADLFNKQGLPIATLNLAEQQFIPQNTSLLVVANPQQDFLPLEKAMLHKYLADGGKLLWFSEPDAKVNAIIAEEFGLQASKGVALDPESLKLGSPHPAVKIITKYPQHDITQGIQSATLLPWSAHLQILYQANDWQQEVFLTTDANTWTYHGPAANDLQRLQEYKEYSGPLNLGVALTRQLEGKASEQRAIVMADSSFMLNKYLPLYANKQLAANIIEWTQHDLAVFVYSPPPLKDLSYNPSKFERFAYQYFFTLLLPLLIVAIAFSSRWHGTKTG